MGHQNNRQSLAIKISRRLVRQVDRRTVRQSPRTVTRPLLSARQETGEVHGQYSIVVLRSHSDHLSADMNET
jgi:hypothetical protein